MKRDVILIEKILLAAKNSEERSVSIAIPDFGVSADELFEALVLAQTGGFLNFSGERYLE